MSGLEGKSSCLAPGGAECGIFVCSTRFTWTPELRHAFSCLVFSDKQPGSGDSRTLDGFTLLSLLQDFRLVGIAWVSTGSGICVQFFLGCRMGVVSSLSLQILNN